MTQLLKQSTAVTVMIGPFLDGTDGKTAETGLTISQADVRLSKNGGSFAQKNEATTCTHNESGYYTCPLNSTDTNTCGILKLAVSESGALPVWHDYLVVTANAYDALMGTDALQVHANEITDALIAASAIADNAITASKLAADVSEEITDVLLKRDWTAISGEPAARSVLNALRFLRNAWTVVENVLTVTKEDDATTAWTGTVSTDSEADPVTGVNPT